MPGLLQKDILALADPVRAVRVARYFKTGEGEYGAGDLFLGLTVPQMRVVSQKYKDLPLEKVQVLLQSKYHEERFIALLLLVHQFQKGEVLLKKKIYDLYLANTKYINNWDLVDLSAGAIVGAYLFDKKRDILVQLAHSGSLWERRISIIATSYFIKHGKEYKDTFQIADILLSDTHDLIHKAVGWMLREVGKQISESIEEEFLKPRCKTMPRTMLRYAIERFPEKKRKQYMRK